ncbi:MAG: MgtC/SapB family protein [Syntrophotalea sp.]|uniref:MgtC/SapB family protein n=1 Tax=Syntrophotalea sp. TaxID=2812029 RepID=UPI003D098ADE
MAMQIWQQFGISLGLGLLVGLQREWAEPEAAGIRSFALISVLGTACAHLAERYGGWVLAAGVVALGGVMIAANFSRAGARDPRPGPTTEVAALVMFAVGALLQNGMVAESVAIGGGVALLLHWKKPLHGFVERIGATDIRAVFRMVLIALVVLPLLPDRSFGPYAVLNPFRIWLMVVLIVGISIAGYLTSRYIGAKPGAILAGVLGGLISSTAATASYARMSRTAPATSPTATLVIMIASTIVFARVAFEVAVVAPGIFWKIFPQFGLMGVWMALIATAACYRQRQKQDRAPVPKDPSNLGAAVIFGGLYALVLLAVAAARQHLGEGGLYLVASLSGLTDMDAITLSTAQLITAGRLGVDTGWRMMMIGALSNILFKAGVVALMGSRRLLGRIAALFGLSLAGGILLLWFWP